MKKAITSLFIVVCAVLTTSFVLPADKKSHAQLNRQQRIDDVEIEITSYASNVNFNVYFQSNTTGQIYLFVLQNTSWANGGLPADDTYSVWVTSNDHSNPYEMQACWEYVEVDGLPATNISVGPGCYQFYIYYNP